MATIKKHLDFTFKKKNLEDGGIRIEGFASTNDVDRVGDVIPASAWDIANYEKNMIILFNHNYDYPIGKAVELEIREDGLYVECLIDPETEAGRHVQNDVLNAFSVGFILKDARYDSITETFVLTEVELLEISVVSVPANPAATFSLGKSCKTDEEYEMLKTKFGKDAKRKGLDPDSENKDMPKNVDTQVTEPTGPEPLTQDQVTDIVKSAVTAAVGEVTKNLEAKIDEKMTAPVVQTDSSADQLTKTLEAKVDDEKFEEVVAELRKELSDKADEITKLNESKHRFPSGKEGDLSDHAKELTEAHILGLLTEKGWDTDFAKRVFEKAAVDVTSAGNAPDVDQVVRTEIERVVELNLRAATLFEHIPVISGATVLPIAPDVEPAVFQTGAAPAGNLENRGDSDNTYKFKQVILNAHRLISQTNINNDTQEQVLINLLPMIVNRVGRAHARAVESMVINGVSSPSITGLAGAGVASGATLDISDSDKLVGANLMTARRALGRFGVNPEDVAYIVSVQEYYSLIEDEAFQDMDKVGPMATKVQGMIGRIFGSNVIVSDAFPAVANAAVAAIAVNPNNYKIPVLRGVNVETDYEVGNQRRVIVAYQSIGFEEIEAGVAGHDGSSTITYVT